MIIMSNHLTNQKTSIDSPSPVGDARSHSVWKYYCTKHKGTNQQTKPDL